VIDILQELLLQITAFFGAILIVSASIFALMNVSIYINPLTPPPGTTEQQRERMKRVYHELRLFINCLICGALLAFVGYTLGLCKVKVATYKYVTDYVKVFGLLAVPYAMSLIFRASENIKMLLKSSGDSQVNEPENSQKNKESQPENAE
jgi:hypothetical protein